MWDILIFSLFSCHVQFPYPLFPVCSPVSSVEYRWCLAHLKSSPGPHASSCPIPISTYELRHQAFSGRHNRIQKAPGSDQTPCGNTVRYICLGPGYGVSVIVLMLISVFTPVAKTSRGAMHGAKHSLDPWALCPVLLESWCDLAQGHTAGKRLCKPKSFAPIACSHYFCTPTLLRAWGPGSDSDPNLGHLRLNPSCYCPLTWDDRHIHRQSFHLWNGNNDDHLAGFWRWKQGTLKVAWCMVNT